jgi:hypothetical protein
MTDAADEYRRRVRELLAVKLEFRRCRRHLLRHGRAGLVRDMARAAEQVHYSHEPALAPVPPEPPAEWDAVAEDVVDCIAHQRWSRLRPTAWAEREANRDRYAVRWPVRGWRLVRCYYRVTAGRAIDCIVRKQDYESYLLNCALAEV